MTQTKANVVVSLLLLTAALTAKASEPPKAEKQHPPRLDHYGDPLPAGAVARIGTIRFRIPSNVNSLSYSPDGKMLAAIGAEGVRVWDPATGKVIQSCDRYSSPGDESFPRGGFDRGFFAPDGRRLWLQSSSAWQNSPGKEIYFLEIKPGSRSAAKKAPFDGKDLHLLAVSPGGKLLAIGEKNSIRICKISTGKNIQRFETTNNQASFSADGNVLASAGGRSIILWNVQTGGEIRSFQPENRRESFENVALTPDGKTVAVFCRGQRLSVRLWDAATGEEKHNLPISDPATRALTFSADGKVLAVACQQWLGAWDVFSGKRLWEHREHNNQFHSVAFSPDCKMLSAGLFGEVRLYDAATGQERPPVKDGERIEFVKLLRDGRTAASAGGGKPLRWWRLPSGEEIPPAPGTTRPVVPEVSDVSPDGKWMASRSHNDRAIRIWDLALGQEIRRLPHRQAPFGSFSPDGRWLQAHDVVQDPNSHNWASELRFWDVRTGKLMSELKGKRASVALFSTDSRLYVTQGAMYGICYLGSVPGGSLLRTIDVGKGPWRFSFSADDRLLAGARLRDEPPHVWEAATGREIATFAGYDGKGPGFTGFSAYEIAFSPDCRKIVTGNSSGHLFCWDVEGRLVCQWRGDDFPIPYLFFTLDGKMLLSGGIGTAVVWKMDEVLPREERRTTTLTAADLNALWSDLKAEDATPAYRAVWKLAAAPDQAIPFLRERLRPAREPDKTNAERIVELIGDLDNDAFAVREKASRELAAFGKETESALRKALASNPSVESKRRIEELLRKMPESLPSPPPEQLRQLRALAVLEYAGTPAAKKCVETLAAGIAEARLTREAKAALQRLAHKSSTAP